MYVWYEVCDFQFVDIGYLDVEESEIWVFCIEFCECVDVVVWYFDDFQFGLQCIEVCGKFGGQVGFVVGDQGCWYVR